MPRKNLIRSKTRPYHVTLRTNNREKFLVPLERVWKLLNDELYEAGMLFEAQVHALVLMPNHIHLLISTPQEDLGVVMHRIVGSLTKRLNLISGRSGRIFGGRYSGCLVDSAAYFANAYKYAYRNPVKAGLCHSVEDYPYSTLQGLFGIKHLPVPLFYPFDKTGFLKIPEEHEAQLSWLNEPFRSEHEKAIQKGLKRSTFKAPEGGWKRQLQKLETDIL